MKQEIQITKSYLSKLFSFYFFRNTKVLKTLIVLILSSIITLVYFGLFCSKLSWIISQFDGIADHVMNSIYLISILILLFVITGWFIFAYFRLYNTSRVNFVEDIIHSYPIDSIQTVELVNGVLVSKNSVDSHLDSYNVSDISIYYIYKGLMFLQTFDNNFIFINYEKNNETDLIKSSSKKKHFLTTLK